MKQRLYVTVLLMVAALFFLTGCQPKNADPDANVPSYESYAGYSNIPDFSSVSGLEADEALTAAAAARLNADPETVRVYKLKETSADSIQAWTKELKTRGFEASGKLEEGGNTVSWYSEDRKIGLVAGYLDTDQKDGVDALGVLLADKSAVSQYVNPDYDAVQEAWSNANSGGRFYIDDKKIYGYGFIGSAEEGFLVKNTDSSNPVMLVEDTSPRFVLEEDKLVYAALPERVITFDTKEKDLEEAITTILEEEVRSLQLYNGKLYYTTKEGLFQAKPDGSDPVKLTGQTMEHAFLAMDKVFYQNPEDENTEHAYSLLTEADTRVTEEGVSSFFLGSKNYAYYIAERTVEEEASEDEDEKSEEEAKTEEETAEKDADADAEEPEEEEPTEQFSLVRLSLKDGETAELASVREGSNLAAIGSKIYFVSDEHEGQIYSVSKSGSTPRRVTRDKDCRYLCVFHDMILYYDYDDETDEGLEHIYISTPDGFMKSDILI